VEHGKSIPAVGVLAPPLLGFGFGFGFAPPEAGGV
jgi:hypothetical protein